MKQGFDFHELISILKTSEFVSKIEVKAIDEVKGRAIYKIRCNLIPSKFKLEIRFVRIEEEILYSYQLFSDKPIIHWDNAPHYPAIKTYPHHFHTRDGNIKESELKGNTIEDLPVVLSMIKAALGGI